MLCTVPMRGQFHPGWKCSFVSCAVSVIEATSTAQLRLACMWDVSIQVLEVYSCDCLAKRILVRCIVLKACAVLQCTLQPKLIYYFLVHRLYLCCSRDFYMSYLAAQPRLISTVVSK